MTIHGLCLWKPLIQKNHRKSFHTLRKTVCVHSENVTCSEVVLSFIKYPDLMLKSKTFSLRSGPFFHVLEAPPDKDQGRETRLRFW